MLMEVNTLSQNHTACGEGKPALTAKCHHAHKHMVHTMKTTGPTCLLAENKKLTGSIILAVQHLASNMSVYWGCI